MSFHLYLYKVNYKILNVVCGYHNFVLQFSIVQFNGLLTFGTK